MDFHVRAIRGVVVLGTIATIALLLVGAAPASRAESDWPTMMGDPGRTGFTAGVPVENEWQHRLSGVCGISECGLAVDKGLAILVASRVVALDMSTGAEVWQTALPGVRSLPAVTGDLVVVTGTRAATPNVNFVAALDLESGAIRWQLERPTDAIPLFSASPVVAGGSVLAPFQDRLVRLSLEGEVQWELLDQQRPSPATIFRGIIFYGDQNGFVHATLPDGSPKWAKDIGGDVPASPLALGESLIVATRRELVSLNADSGEELWRAQLCEGTVAAPASSSGVIVIPCGRELQAFDPSGRRLWSYVAPTGLAPGAAIAQGSVLALDDSGTAVLLDLASGRELFTLRMELSGAPAAPAWNGATGLLVADSPAPHINFLDVMSFTMRGSERETPAWGGGAAVVAGIVGAAWRRRKSQAARRSMLLATYGSTRAR